MTFGLDNLPYGSVVSADGRRVAAIRFGDSVLDLASIDRELFPDGSLDAFLAAGRETWAQIRAAAAEVLAADRYRLTPLADVRPVLAFAVADYVDFYASEHHATNAGRIMRPGSSALPASWRHQPIGYYGRAGAVVVSGTEITRPRGQTAVGETTRYGPTECLDLEAELAFVIGVPSETGRLVRPDEADDYVFGCCLLNDWSARDVQRFESVPLGPLLGKSFATSVSAWITPLAALDAARTGTVQHPPPLPHLHESGPHGLDINLELRVNGTLVSRPRFADMYWSYAQMLAHLTSNGSGTRTGDLFGSGTVSGPEPAQRGCLLELTWNGTQPLVLDDGTARSWLADGDDVVLSAQAGSITLGEVRGRIGACE